MYSINFPDDLTIKFNLIKYPAGESQIRIVESEIKKIQEAAEIHVTFKATTGEGLIQLALLTDALNSLNTGAKYTLIMPYLPYGRADRRFVDGDCFGLKVFGKFIDELMYDQVVTFDAHSIKAKRYITNLIDISPVQVIKDLMERLKTETRSYPAIILPDKGAADRLGELSQHYKTYTCSKKRDPKNGQLLGFEVPSIAEPNALIVDDICDGGGTFMGIAGEISPRTKLYLFVSHGVFSQGQRKFFPYFKDIYTTDSFTPQFSNDEGLATKIPLGGLIRKEILGSTARIFKEAIN